jgi:hypothetical protein
MICLGRQSSSISPNASCLRSLAPVGYQRRGSNDTPSWRGADDCPSRSRPASASPRGRPPASSACSPTPQEQAIERLLDRVVRALHNEGIADLDTATSRLTEGSWFRFHRRLRFGLASGEYDPDLRALVLVDREAVENYSVNPGLLMFGSPEHLRPPYRSQQIDTSPGARTGSSTGTLFHWLQTTRKLLEADPAADLNKLWDGLSLESPDAPHVMYEVLARPGWMGKPGFPRLLDRRPCEGLAEVSLIAADDGRTTVMATPLYVRVRQLPELDDPTKDRRRSLRSLLPRLIRHGGDGPRVLPPLRG